MQNNPTTNRPNRSYSDARETVDTMSETTLKARLNRALQLLRDVDSLPAHARDDAQDRVLQHVAQAHGDLETHQVQAHVSIGGN